MAKKAQTAPTSGVITVGIDIGYGVTKALIADAAPVLFPSVWGHARTVRFQADKLTADYPGEQLTDEDGQWFIGELARSQLTAAQLLLLRGRTANEQEVGNAARVRLAKAAIGKLLAGRVARGDAVHVRIATGLPVDHMAGAADLKAALMGQHAITTDAADFVVNIADVSVMPQPYGTIYANTLTAKGAINPCHTATRTGVVDVGTYTIDLALDDNGEFIDTESGSVEAGVYMAQQALAQQMSDTYGQTLKQGSIDRLMQTGCVTIKGKTISHDEDVTSALGPIRSATITKMNELWRAGAEVDVIYLSGGGAALVEAAVKEAGYSQAMLVENAQLANARGYLNYALFKETEGV